MNIVSKFLNIFRSEKGINNLQNLIEDHYASSFISGNSNLEPSFIPPRSAYNILDRSSCLGDAVDRISESIAALKLALKKTHDTELEYNNPLLDLLNSPSINKTSLQFWYDITESFLITNEAWIVARGAVNRPPIELLDIKPYDITIGVVDNTGYPVTIRTNAENDKRVYTRFLDKGRYRYFDSLKLNELFPVIGSLSLNGDFRGRSPLKKLYYDLLMNTDGKRSNVAILQNGMRTSGILSPRSGGDGMGAQVNWSPENVQKMQDYIRANNQGSGNAGNLLIVGRPLEVQGLQQTNRDMEFLSLLSTSQNSVYNFFRIPLALINTDAQTYDNYTTANRVYYTKAVFPKFDRIADGLMMYLSPRFNLDKEYQLTYSIVDIKDLQTVVVEDMKKLRESQSVSTDEVRSIGGYEPIEGGEAVLVAATLVPLNMVSAPISFPDITVNSIEEDSESEVLEDGEQESASPDSTVE